MFVALFVIGTIVPIIMVENFVIRNKEICASKQDEPRCVMCCVALSYEEGRMKHGSCMCQKEHETATRNSDVVYRVGCLGILKKVSED